MTMPKHAMIEDQRVIFTGVPKRKVDAGRLARSVWTIQSNRQVLEQVTGR